VKTSFRDLWVMMEEDQAQQPEGPNAQSSGPQAPDQPPSADPNSQGNELQDSGEESPAMRVIRTGMNFEGDFWEDFKSISGDADGLSDLLGIPRHKITSWATKIDELKDKVEKIDGGGDDKKKKKQELVPTGHEPMAGPEGQDSNADGPADTRPMP